MRDHSAAAPAAYPHVHFMTAPLRAAARASGDPEPLNLWAGEGFAHCREVGAPKLVGALAAESEAAMRALCP
jgi:nitronate monooxygenase